MMKSWKSSPIVTLALVVLLLIAAAVNAAVMYVDPGGSNSNSGTSPRNAFKNISSAINHAVAGDQVYVLPGYYKENIRMKSDVSVYGSGPEQTTIEGFRDPKYAAAIPYCGQCHYLHNTTTNGTMFNLSGDPSGTISAVDVTNATLAGFTIALENQDFYYHGWNKAVFIKGNTDNTFVMQNNVIYTPPNTNISNSSDPSKGDVGIGIMVAAPANPTIRSNTIYGPSLPLQAGYGKFGVVWGITGTSGTSSSGDFRNNIIHGYDAAFRAITIPAMDYNAYSMDNTIGVTPTINDIVAPVAFRWGNYRLAENSAAIDRGDPAIIDLDGTRSDMGAYGGSYMADTDNDGIIDIFDNCPNVFNPDQEDWDGNGIGNACDPTPMGPLPPPTGTGSIAAPDGTVQVCVQWPTAPATGRTTYVNLPDCNNVILAVTDNITGLPLAPVCLYPEYDIANTVPLSPSTPQCVTCKLSDRYPDLVGRPLSDFTITTVSYESFITDPWFDQNSGTCINPITGAADSTCRDIWIGKIDIPAPTKLTPVITWTPGLLPAGSPLSSTQLNATADVAGAFSYAPTAGTILPVGPTTVTATFTPADGFSYRPVFATAVITNFYDWTGFFSPIDMTLVNKVKAGSAIPIKFSLGGDKGLAVFAAGYPISVDVTSFTGVIAVNDITDLTISTAGGSGLSYDPVSTQYTYVWKTDKAWAGTKRQLQVKLKDGTTHTANFTFTK